jgi:polo-like kinase 1
MKHQKNVPEDPVPQTLIEKILKPNGDVIFRHYSRGPLQGKGSFAKVYKLTCTESNSIHAGKVISKSILTQNRTRQKIMSEIKIHKSLRHNNIVQFENFFEDNNYLYILLELCNNQTLADLLRRRKRITELEAQCYLFQVISGMKYLHSHRIIHRDIKLGNIFISDNMEIKIGDFGLAAKLEYEGERKRTICGTPNYMAPEIINSKFGHSYECDVWSFGVLMYALIIGKPPYESHDIKTTYSRIKSNLYKFPENLSISSEAKSLISSILVLDYAKRPSFDEILRHEFFNKNAIPKLLPQSSLAVPPSSGYIKQFESRGRNLNKSNSMTRAHTQDHINQTSVLSPVSERPHSKDPEKLLYSETKSNPIQSRFYFEGNSVEIWIKSWLDLSNKYGIGYLLSNNWVGVLFNDKTKLISTISGDSIYYFTSFKDGEQMSSFNISNYPEIYYKKMKLMELFKKQFNIVDLTSAKTSQVFYLKNWFKSAHATIFRTSNKFIQVYFNDQTELLFASGTRNVSFLNKKHELVSCPISVAIETANNEMIKRLKYSKEVLLKELKSFDKVL